MAESDADLAALYGVAHTRHVVVIGGGMAGLVAAWELAKVGIRVTLLEAADTVGGVLRGGEVDGILLDLGAESYATRGGHVDELVEALDLSGDIVTPERSAGGAWVAGIPGVGAAPIPPGGVLGIPANPFDESVRRVIGWAGAWRCYLDRLRPVLTIGHEHSLGRLVRSRLGDRVLDRLVAPVTSGVYSAHPDLIDPDVAAPGLNAALTRAGSLTGAVALLAAERTSAPGGAVRGIRGGVHRLASALRGRLELLGVEVRTGALATALIASETGWSVSVDGEDDALAADAVIVATTEAPARQLLAPLIDELAAEPEVPGPEVEIVTLVLDATAIDGTPRGTGVLTVPGSHTAKALTHANAKWGWIAEAAAGRQVVRVSFGSQGEPPASTGLQGDALAELALAEAGALLGVSLERGALRGIHRERFSQSQPAAALGRAEESEIIRAQVAQVTGLGVVGAWISGTGLAQVVPDARTEADRLRRVLLFE